MRPIISRSRHAGFTLIEAIAVIVITGILFTIVASLIRLPIAGAVDTARRAAMADNADAALRRIKREVQTALPNSVRVAQNGGRVFIEFIPVRGGGRYCVAPDAGSPCSSPSATADALDFTAADTSFEAIGPLIAQPTLNAAGAQLVIFNLGIPGADAYEGSNRTPVAAINAAATPVRINFTARQFPFESPGARFHIVGQPVTYVCTEAAGGGAAGTLMRYTGYGFQAAQQTNAAFYTALPAASSALVARDIERCIVDYNQALTDRYGLIAITLHLRNSGEGVTLTHQIQVNNVP